jgi:CubicO group peptidase (beta-lactamase class C family)
LLTHTSGIYNYTNSPDFLATMMLKATPESIIARVKDRPLDFKPGEKFNYSNSGYIVLGMIIEKVSGKSYAEFLDENIFKPLKMDNTGYDSTSRIIPNRAEGYGQNAGKLINASFIDMSVPFAAGALESTVGDLYIWDQALYSDRLLTEKSKSQMFTPSKGTYAYGWNVDAVFNHKRISHGGGIPGFATFIERFPDDHVTIIVLSNFDFANSGKIGRDLAALVFGQQLETPREPLAVKLDPKILDSYVGEYQVTADHTLVVTRDGDHLRGQFAGQALELIPESDTQFFTKLGDLKLTFVKDASGRIAKVIMRQGDRDQPAPKVR